MFFSECVIEKFLITPQTHENYNLPEIVDQWNDYRYITVQWRANAFKSQKYRFSANNVAGTLSKHSFFPSNIGVHSPESITFAIVYCHASYTLTSAIPSRRLSTLIIFKVSCNTQSKVLGRVPITLVHCFSHNLEWGSTAKSRSFVAMQPRSTSRSTIERSDYWMHLLSLKKQW